MVGSATTYARRYSLSGAVGIVSDDDDGNGAVQGGRGEAIESERKVYTPTAQESPTEVPAGYDDWLTDLIAAADEGIAPFEAAFSKSKMEYRRHLTQTDVEKYGNLRAKARRVGAPLKATK